MVNSSSACGCLEEYETPKLVTVRSRCLGLCYYGWMGLISIYIVFYVCGYNCRHLAKVPVSGVTRLTIQQPTQGCNPMDYDCNSDFQSAANLPYCKCLHRNATVVPLARTLDCMYKDGVDLTTQIPVPGTFFVHTRISNLDQTRDCHPEQAADRGCHGTLYRSPTRQIEDTSVYIADIESFTLLFGHGFTASDPDVGKRISGQSGDLLGYVESGGTTHEFPDRVGFPSTRKIKHLGDIISVGDLLKLANGRTLDDSMEEGDTLRWAGGIIHVRVVYANKRAFDIFGQTAPYYTMTADLLPISEFKKMYGERSDNDTIRRVYDVHGILIIAEVSGYMSVFSPLELLKVLTTSIAMLAVARIVVDGVMMYCHHQRDKLRLLKSQRARDFDESDDDLDQYDGDMNRAFATHGDASRGYYATNLLRRCAENEECPKDNDLLYILLCMEKRLNHLDAEDVEVVRGSADHEPIQRNMRTYLDSRRLLDYQDQSRSTGSDNPDLRELMLDGNE